jgi:neuropeptide Y receptor type 1
MEGMDSDPVQLSTISDEIFNVTICVYPRITKFDAILWISYITKVYLMPIVAVFGFIGNSLAFVVLSKEMKATSTTVLLKVLAVADNFVLIMYVLLFSFGSVYEFTGQFLSYQKFFEMTKSYSWALLWFTKVISVYVVVCVTVERFVAVCRPHKSRTWCKIQNAWIAVGYICLFSFIYNIPKCFYFETKLRYDPCLEESVPIGVDTVLGKNKYFKFLYKVILYVIVVFIIPLITILILNYQLIKAVKKGHRRESFRKGRRSSYYVITKRVIAVCCAFIVLELPAIVMNIIEFSAHVEELVKGCKSLYLSSETAFGLLHLSYMFSTLNSCVNFYIYFLTSNEFRRTLKWMVFGLPNRLDRGMSSRGIISNPTVEN